MIEILKPGLLSSIQDLGRFGYQKFGVIVSGVMDQLAHRLANLLVGNLETAPTLELTLLGPSIAFKEEALIAICGGDLSPIIDGKPVRMWRPIYVKAGSNLIFGPCRSGCRAYLAVAGGFDIPKVMESYSTYIRAGIGGFKGRALKGGDNIPFGQRSSWANRMIEGLAPEKKAAGVVEFSWSVAPDVLPLLESEPKLRVMAGRQAHLFDHNSREKLFTEPFTISPQSDRMGYRLSGPQLKLETPEELISEAVTFGTIQVPSNGNPIILLADRQTTGGYPKIGQVITVDLPKIAQLKPGDKVRFQKVSQEEAQQLLLERELKIQQLKNGILLRSK
ncbi:antagonist of KipI [Pullulanibacillus pueri]|uniref:KipI antagonist n=1 Tax=Pullulanibacillus pueri TaxID=1437324 RepID=A0A8J3A0D6_9BACL|nr:biotin-dependent carboxyltransferase family protein [Pullulanibacillus pueri]MBM7684099.1 antagonist of KipI [Pullulanibacillus pueri]GGH88651.1 KipI antagonist [Pullulanibacillus pueri]